MYRADAIKENFLHLLGWRQNYDTAEFAISDSLTESETGQYFQDMHPLITLDNIRSITPRFNTDAPEYEDKEYKQGEIVSYNGKLYKLIQTTNKDGETESYIDPSNVDYWAVYDQFSDWLQTKTEASIMKAFETYYSAQMQDRAAKNILESKVLFDAAGRLTDVIRPTNSLVGFEIIPIRAEGVTLKIEKIGMQFNAPGKVKLYLMHSSSPDPIKTIDVDYTKKGGIQWTDTPDLYLPYMSEETDAGGSWYLCYSQKELQDGMMAIEKNRDWSKEPCPTCSRVDYISWQAWSKYMEIHPFKVPAPESVTMWDVSENLYTYTTNYGINLKTTIECDLTDIFVDQRKSFQNVIGLQVAADMIREFAYNPNFRINRTQQNFSRNELLYELDGDSTSNKPGGLLYRLDKAMQAIRIDTTGINRICLPCSNGGIRYRSI